MLRALKALTLRCIERGRKWSKDAILHNLLLSLLAENIAEKLKHHGVDRLTGRLIEKDIDHAAERISLSGDLLKSGGVIGPAVVH